MVWAMVGAWTTVELADFYGAEEQWTNVWLKFLSYLSSKSQMPTWSWNVSLIILHNFYIGRILSV
jgi:hypothetical protein